MSRAISRSLPTCFPFVGNHFVAVISRLPCMSRQHTNLASSSSCTTSSFRLRDHEASHSPVSPPSRLADRFSIPPPDVHKAGPDTPFLSGKPTASRSTAVEIRVQISLSILFPRGRALKWTFVVPRELAQQKSRDPSSFRDRTRESHSVA